MVLLTTITVVTPPALSISVGLPSSPDVLLSQVIINSVGCVGRTVPMLFTLMSLLYNFFPYSNQRSLIFSVSYMN